jgi:hypothetical protein
VGANRISGQRIAVIHIIPLTNQAIVAECTRDRESKNKLQDCLPRASEAGISSDSLRPFASWPSLTQEDYKETMPQVVKSHQWHGHVSSYFMIQQHCFNMYYHEPDKSHNILVKSTSTRA